jgi:hypothetical protein
MLHSWQLLLRFLFWFFTSLINQLHQLACFSHENTWARQLQYCEWYAIIIASNSLRTLFVIPAAAVTWFRNWAHWTTLVIHACDQERSNAVEEFLHHLLHKNSDRSSIWDWQEHAGVHKSTPEIERWWQQNEFMNLALTMCSQLSELWDIKPIKHIQTHPQH